MKRLMILILLLLPLQYGKGQNLEQFFRTYHKEQGVDAIHIGNITMKLAGLFTETLGVNGIEILDLGEATETLRQRFQDEVKSFKDPEFETLLTENDKEDHTKILVKIKDEMIRELVIFQTGSDCSFIRIKGRAGKRWKLRPSKRSFSLSTPSSIASPTRWSTKKRRPRTCCKRPTSAYGTNGMNWRRSTHRKRSPLPFSSIFASIT